MSCPGTKKSVIPDVASQRPAIRSKVCGCGLLEPQTGGRHARHAGCGTPQLPNPESSCLVPWGSCQFASGTSEIFSAPTKTVSLKLSEHLEGPSFKMLVHIIRRYCIGQANEISTQTSEVRAQEANFAFRR